MTTMKADTAKGRANQTANTPGTDRAKLRGQRWNDAGSVDVPGRTRNGGRSVNASEATGTASHA